MLKERIRHILRKLEMSDRPPRFGSSSFTCPHCGAIAQQQWFDTLGLTVDRLKQPYSIKTDDIYIESHVRIQGYESKDVPQKLIDFEIERRDKKVERLQAGVPFFEGRDDINEPKLVAMLNKLQARGLVNLHVTSCHVCSELAIWLGGSIIYPKTNGIAEPNPDFTSEIKNYYNKAALIFKDSPEAAAALLRLCVQLHCEELGEAGKDLNNAIGNLVSKGLIESDVQEALDVVRVVGNEAVHPGKIVLEDDPKVAHSLFNLLNYICEKTVSEPKRRKALFEGLPRSKKEQISKRDGVE